MPLVVRYLFFAAAILHLLMVVVSGERTALHCTTANYTNATVLIVFAGQYDVSCIGSFEWFVWVIGCASNGTINSRVVSIRLLNSPIQVIISDNTTLLSSSTTAHNATLAGCSVDITYLSDTVVPIASSNVTYPPVYVSSTSFMGNISVVLVATLYLEGAFIFITGNISGGIESVTLRCDQGSSIVCANNSYIICSPIQGTSLIVLAPGCPQIGALSVHLNGTNVTGSMWLRTASTSSASSFSFALVDHYTLASLTPRSTSVVVKDVQGLMVMSTVLAVRTIFPGTPPLFALDGYGVQRVSVIVENSTMTADPSKFDPMFFLKNAVSLQLTLISVSCTGHVLSAVVPETNDSISSEGAMLWPIIIHVVNSSLRTAGKSFFFNIPNTFNGTVLGRSVVSTSAVKSTFVLEGTDAELLQFVAFSSSSTLPPLLFTVSIVLSQCTINTTLNSVKLLYTSSFGQPPILHNSSIVFEDSVVYQTWETFVNLFGTDTPPVPLIQMELNKTSIVFTRCNILVQQISSPTTPSVALLLSINNAMTTSSLHFINSSIIVATKPVLPLRTFPISVNAMSSSNITVTNTTLTNLLALVQLRNISKFKDFFFNFPTFTFAEQAVTFRVTGATPLPSHRIMMRDARGKK
ncbi:membrane-associated protein, putative [Bodo saltans]|uniref:Membrane-associated protein, putative n=1 Tax=Bodo saltans TaxID=75058 RepID=A0A0S4IQM1_BODSA|nr:membrane-associated protein, putative [Bodo saltans]|eukprot:CUF20591.1 membrane-associated protein, putative [Bodo saltans]